MAFYSYKNPTRVGACHLVMLTIVETMQVQPFLALSKYRISLINTPGILLFSCLKSKLYVRNQKSDYFYTREKLRSVYSTTRFKLVTHAQVLVCINTFYRIFSACSHASAACS